MTETKVRKAKERPWTRERTLSAPGSGSNI